MKKRISTFLLVLMSLVTCQQIMAQDEVAQISFDVTEASYVMGSGETFTPPVLNNLDNVQVWYTSSDYSVASVGYYDGNITFVSEGETTITANSYNAGSASYKLKITDARPDAGISFDVTEYTYEMGSGEEFVAPTLNNPNNVNVTYVTSDWNIASADYYSGKVTIFGVGKVTITAESQATETYQASKASYTLEITDPSLIYTAPFTNDNAGFKEEGSNGVWQWNQYGYIMAQGGYSVTELTECYMVSPEIQLDPAGNIVTFDHMASNFYQFAEDAQLVVREIGGEWVSTGELEMPSQYQYSSTGKIWLPEEFNGKKVQIGFKYVTDGYNKNGTWYIKNLCIRKYIQKNDPEIAFDVTEVKHDISKTFEAPVLKNPHGVKITYASSNPGVATIDAEGMITIFGEGETTISATSTETKVYEEKTVSYTLTVTDESKILVATFNDDDCGFKEEGELAGTGKWMYQYGYMYASGGNTVTEPTNCYLVSPEFTLKSNNTVQFEQLPQNFTAEDNLDLKAQLLIREAGGEWVKIEGLNYPEPGAWTAEMSDLMNIPEQFNGKTVQIAFNYIADGSYFVWWVRNLIVRGQEPEEEKLAIGKIYEESFRNGHFEEGYTVEGDNGDPDNYRYLWYLQDGCENAYAYGKIGDRKNIESYLVSPEIQLAESDNTAEFMHVGYYFPGDMADAVSMCVREIGGEWVTLEGMQFGGEYEEASTGAMAVPEQFNGKKVQFGFRYTAESNSSCGLWRIRDFVVKGMIPEKQEAGISFDVTDVEYSIGSEKPFTAPVLNNPNNLEITYTSSNSNIAEVDDSGNVTIKSNGKVVISAFSKETIDFMPDSTGYTLTVTDPTIVYSADFGADMCGFTEESDVSDVKAWMRYWEGCIMADAYMKLANEYHSFYFISPEFTLDPAGNKISMEHKTQYFGDIKKDAQLVIREVGSTEWTNIEGIHYSDNEEWCNSGEVMIPSEFNGKNVQIAFKYSSNGYDSGVWYIKNVIIRKAAQKADPEISFAETEVTYVVGSGDFVAPELNNPNNVEVVYSSSNKDIAEVVEGGWVYIYDLGTVTITATSVENDQFKSATASYTLTITDVPTGIEGITADELNSGKIYDLQGRRLNHLQKGINIVNGKKVIVK